VAHRGQIKRFFEWMFTNDADIKKIQGDQCATIFEPVFIKQGWSKDFGNERIIDKLYEQLSGTPRSAEMAYLDKELNGSKANVTRPLREYDMYGN